jgi:uncharacterized protein YcfJ
MLKFVALGTIGGAVVGGVAGGAVGALGLAGGPLALLTIPTLSVGGALLGGAAGFAGGAIIGSYVCAPKSTTCDNTPKAVPIPYPTPNTIPLVPPFPPMMPRTKDDDKGGKTICFYQHIDSVTGFCIYICVRPDGRAFRMNAAPDVFSDGKCPFVHTI